MAVPVKRVTDAAELVQKLAADFAAKYVVAEQARHALIAEFSALVDLGREIVAGEPHEGAAKPPDETTQEDTPPVT